MIPSKIIFTHKSLSTLRPHLRTCIKRMRKMHSGWDVDFYSDGDCRDYMKRYLPQYLEVYDWYPRGVLKADFFRIAAVYNSGGFYFDTDFWATHNLDELKQRSVVFPWEMEFSTSEISRRYPEGIRESVESWQVGNYAFAAEPRHPFLKEILDEMIRRTSWLDVENCSDDDVLRATGPDVVTTVYYRTGEALKVSVLSGCPKLVTPKRFREIGRPDTWFKFGKFGIHLITGSWRR